MKNIRQIVLDTETTGLSAQLGHRIIEIGCVELIDRNLTGNHFHYYLNPQRQVDKEAFKVHGLSDQFLQDKPLFKDIAKDFIQFIDGAELIIHNAKFDLSFLGSELNKIKWPKPILDYCTVSDTLILAKNKHPGQRVNLDALCKYYNIKATHRKLHGALLDAEILANVYLAMTGGQGSLFEEESIERMYFTKNTHLTQDNSLTKINNTLPIIFPTREELKIHEEFMQELEKL